MLWGAEVPAQDMQSMYVGFVIATYMSIFLNGILTLQTWNYFRSRNNDRLYSRILVASIYVLDTVDTIIFAWLKAYYSSPTDFSLGGLPATPLYATSYAIEAAITSGVQSYYCLRIYSFSNNLVSSLPGALFALMHFAAEVWIVAIMSSYGGPASFGDTGRTIRGPLFMSRVSGALADVIISASLCVSMCRMRSGMPASNKVVDKLIAFTCGSGLLPTICTIVALITMRDLPKLRAVETPVLSVFSIGAAKAYANSLLATLNARKRLREEMVAEEPKLSSLNFQNSTPALSLSSQTTESLRQHNT